MTWGEFKRTVDHKVLELIREKFPPMTLHDESKRLDQFEIGSIEIVRLLPAEVTVKIIGLGILEAGALQITDL